MCGILGTIIDNNKNDLQFSNLFEILFNQRDRGTRGGGVSVLSKGELVRFRSTTPFFLTSYHLSNLLWSKLKKNDKLIFHHRIPTSTENKEKCNHPISNEDNTIHLIHNGHITNAYSLKYKLSEKGHTFETKDQYQFTDSEVLVHLIEEGIKKHSDKNMTKVMQYVHKKVYGSYAIAFFIKSHDCIYLFRKTNPLVVYKDIKNNFYFSSEKPKSEELYPVCKTFANGEFGKLTIKGYTKLGEIETDTIEYQNLDEWNKNFGYGYGCYNNNHKNSSRKHNKKSKELTIYEEEGELFPDDDYMLSLNKNFINDITDKISYYYHAQNIFTFDDMYAKIIAYVYSEYPEVDIYKNQKVINEFDNLVNITLNELISEQIIDEEEQRLRKVTK